MDHAETVALAAVKASWWSTNIKLASGRPQGHANCEYGQLGYYLLIDSTAAFSVRFVDRWVDTRKDIVRGVTALQHRCLHRQ